MATDLLIGLPFVLAMAVLCVVLLLLILPVRVTAPLARFAAFIDRVALAMGLLEPCPTCGVPSEELGRQGTRRWLYCPACGRNPWLAAPTDHRSSEEVGHEVSA